MAYFDHEFEALVTYHDVGSTRYQYTVVWVPTETADQLPLAKYPRLRVVGEIDDHPIEAALTPVRGRWYVLLSKALLQAIERHVGDRVTVRFAIADQDAVDVPEALATALAHDEEHRELWTGLTPGKQRALCYMVASAKTLPTAQKRVAVVFDILGGRRDMRGKLIT